MKFGLARVYRIKIEYYKDSLPDIKYTMSFFSHASLTKWINEHVDYTITQMLLRYEYPEN